MKNAILIEERLADKEVAVPSFRRRPSVIDADHVDEPKQDPDRAADAADALSLAEEAEAEAAEAEAIAAAARARARAMRLRSRPRPLEATRRLKRKQRPSRYETEVTDVEPEADEAGADTRGQSRRPSDDVAEAPTKEKPVRERRRWGLVA